MERRLSWVLPLPVALFLIACWIVNETQNQARVQLARGNQLYQYQLIGQSLPETSANSGQPIRQLAREHGTQLVLSGALHDLGMARPGDAPFECT